MSTGQPPQTDPTVDQPLDDPLATDPATREQSFDLDADAQVARSSTLTRVVIPLVALTMVVAMLGLLAYALLKPDDDGEKIADGGYVVYERPEEARDFELTTFDGEAFKLSEQRGSVLVLNFWASWCEPCKEEMPLLVNADGALGDDVQLVGINAQDSESSARDFIAEYRAEYAMLRSGDGVAIDYGVTAFPETYVIDREGRIVAYFPGAISSLQQLQQMVAEADES